MVIIDYPKIKCKGYTQLIYSPIKHLHESENFAQVFEEERIADTALLDSGRWCADDSRRGRVAERKMREEVIKLKNKNRKKKQLLLLFKFVGVDKLKTTIFGLSRFFDKPSRNQFHRSCQLWEILNNNHIYNFQN